MKNKTKEGCEKTLDSTLALTLELDTCLFQYLKGPNIIPALFLF